MTRARQREPRVGRMTQWQRAEWQRAEAERAGGTPCAGHESADTDWDTSPGDTRMGMGGERVTLGPAVKGAGAWVRMEGDVNDDGEGRAAGRWKGRRSDRKHSRRRDRCQKQRCP